MMIAAPGLPSPSDWNLPDVMETSWELLLREWLQRSLQMPKSNFLSQLFVTVVDAALSDEDIKINSEVF